MMLINSKTMTTILLSIGTAFVFSSEAEVKAQGAPSPQFASLEVQSDKRISFRLFAAGAKSVRLSSSDIPGLGAGGAMTKNSAGVWEITTSPVSAGAYRYAFLVDGISTIDPKNPATSESAGNVWSLATVSESDLMDVKNVPHGAVSTVVYHSTSLNLDRRMHIYTPPGYGNGKGKFPVFYLLHGAGDCDDSWTSVGRAGFILDNLIAAGKAKPMIVAMPAGHVRSFSFGAPPRSGPQPPADEFEQDFIKDILPTVEKDYRVLADRKNRAIAGLSMGGAQTLNLFIPNQKLFAYVGVFSSGLFKAFPFRRPGEVPPTTASGKSPWEEAHLSELTAADSKHGLKLVWLATGKDDFLLQISHSTVDLLKNYGFKPVYEESEGGHTWLNWRNYLVSFATKLFQ